LRHGGAVANILRSARRLQSLLSPVVVSHSLPLPLPLPQADAFFNQDVDALKALLADDVVQHAGRWRRCPPPVVPAQRRMWRLLRKG
jgi:hypothetical protein